MDWMHRLEISYYKTVATINEAHKVYLVQHQKTSRIYVKKILDVYNIDVYTSLFSNPIPGTPRIIDFFEENDQLILIEEYISGTPLYDKILSRDLNIEEILNYTVDLCHILEKLHSLDPPTIHRDIKPSNIIITNYNHAVLLDFNAAKQFTSSEREDTILLGTQGYAAPEQYGFGSSTPQTDIYSLGIVLKEMLSASGLFSEGVVFSETSSRSGTLTRSQAKDQSDVPARSELRVRSKALIRIVKKCTQMNPKERYSSIKALLKDLDPLCRQLQPSKEQPEVSGFWKYLLPGFRTHTPWKMLIASIFYLLIFWLGLTIEVHNVYGFALWVERILFLLMMLSIIFGCFNYLKVQKIFPLCQHRNRLVRYLGIVLLDVCMFIALLVIMVIFHSLFVA